jgi:hypothetical protein
MVTRSCFHFGSRTVLADPGRNPSLESFVGEEPQRTTRRW